MTPQKTAPLRDGESPIDLLRAILLERTRPFGRAVETMIEGFERGRTAWER